MSCAHALSVELRISAQRNQIRLRQIMDGKLRLKRLCAQVPQFCHPERSRGISWQNAKATHRDSSTPLRSARNDRWRHLLPRSMSSTS
jgi:hypothetical protein